MTIWGRERAVQRLFAIVQARNHGALNECSGDRDEGETDISNTEGIELVLVVNSLSFVADVKMS